MGKHKLHVGLLKKTATIGVMFSNKASVNHRSIPNILVGGLEHFYVPQYMG